MAIVYQRPKALTDVNTHYCPGCTHGIIHRLIAEVMDELDIAAMISRVAVNNPANVIKAKKAIKQAFLTQQKGLGFSMVEVLSTCPTNWGLNPIEALKWLEDNMIPYYPLKD